MAKYVYPAVFTPEENSFSIHFPDIEGCYTCGDSIKDGMEMAKDALALMLTHLEDEKSTIPAASSIHAIHLNGDSFAAYISCDTTVYRRLMNNTSEIKRLGTEALINALGPIGMARYLEEYDNGGQGDYTKEKYEMPDEIFPRRCRTR